MSPALELTGVLKRYGALRPLRIGALVVERGQRVALAGLDAAASEVLLNLITGATLPDEGEVRVFDESTADVTDERAWFAWIDRFGILSPRAVLLDGLAVRQNIAMPLTLDIDPMPGDVAGRVEALAAEVGLPPAALERAVGAVSPEAKARIHLARALALDPRILLLEHPTTLLPSNAVAPFAGDIARLARARGLSLLAMTEDRDFAARVADRSARLDAATGEVRAVGGWRRWL